jgi:hypothetical protein
LGFSSPPASLAATPAAADNFYQGKRITLVVGFNPGGGIDTAGRLIASTSAASFPATPASPCRTWKAPEAWSRRTP